MPGTDARSGQFERAMRQRNRLLEDGVRDPARFAGLETHHGGDRRRHRRCPRRRHRRRGRDHIPRARARTGLAVSVGDDRA